MIEEVKVAGIPTPFYLRPMSGRQAFAYFERLEGITPGMQHAVLIQSCLCDANGAPMPYSEDEIADWPFPIVRALSQVALRISGLGDDALEDAKKNSAATLDSNDGSTSPTA